jgi:phosphatidate cytidylyltransferase
MLGQRIVTAVVLLALLLPALFASRPEPFAMLTLLLLVAGGWEWGRLNGAGAAQSVALAVALAGAAALTWAAGWALSAPLVLWWPLAAAWVIGLTLALRLGPSSWPLLGRGPRWVIGLVVLWAAWLAVVNARARGVPFILSVLCIVWVADIAAYFGGRLLGRRKLAPAISPGKTWEGAWTGAGGVLLLALAWSMAERAGGWSGAGIFTTLWDRLGPFGTVLALSGLTALSVCGDLFESLVKRAAGVKDSSRLLPGHGGVLDRVDALLPVLPAAMAIALA